MPKNFRKYLQFQIQKNLDKGQKEFQKILWPIKIIYVSEIFFIFKKNWIAKKISLFLFVLIQGKIDKKSFFWKQKLFLWFKWIALFFWNGERSSMSGFWFGKFWIKFSLHMSYIFHVISDQKIYQNIFSQFSERKSSKKIFNTPLEKFFFIFSEELKGRILINFLSARNIEKKNRKK